MSEHHDEFAQPRIVARPSIESMDGATRIHKWLNAYLTKQFVVKHEVPSDECLSEAQHIIDVINATNLGYEICGDCDGFGTIETERTTPQGWPINISCTACKGVGYLNSPNWADGEIISHGGK